MMLDLGCRFNAKKRRLVQESDVSDGNFCGIRGILTMFEAPTIEPGPIPTATPTPA
jgi:hypothetical protein